MSGILRVVQVATLAAVAAALAGGRGSVRRPSVVLVSIDGLRADHVGAYGYRRPTTPTIDRLAKEGTIFTHAITPSPACLPAVASLLTGTGAMVHGLARPGGRLAATIETVAEAFHRGGYRTVGIFANPSVPASAGLQRGFEAYVDCREPGRRGRAGPGGRQGSGGCSQCVVRGLARELSNPGARPLFLFVDLESSRCLPGPDRRGQKGAGARTRPPSGRAAWAKERARRVALYDLRLRLADDSLEAVLGRLGVSGLLADSVVVVTADHGEELGEHGGWGYGRTLYEEVLRVPLVFWGPGRIAAGRRLDALVSIADVAPTLADLGGLPRLPTATGRSLTSDLAGRGGWGRPVLSTLFGAGRLRHALHLNPWFKVISGPRFEYYLLDRDPGERDPRPAAWGYAVLGRRTLARAVAAAREKARQLRGGQ